EGAVTAMADIALRCACGTVRGALAHDGPGDVARVICHCADCRGWARTTATADQFVDSDGGVDLIQVAPARARFDAGTDQLVWRRMTPKGPYRFHAACCGAAIGVTAPSPAFAHLSLPLSVVDVAADARDARFGRPWGRIFAKDATRPVEGASVYKRASPGLALRFISRLLGHRLRGRAKPHPLFTANGDAVGGPAPPS
ncbi:MAG: DUF6151 family protein, partial [Pseudomonadota bacterium]